MRVAIAIGREGSRDRMHAIAVGHASRSIAVPIARALDVGQLCDALARRGVGSQRQHIAVNRSNGRRTVLASSL
jgi:hypothetical protein